MSSPSPQQSPVAKRSDAKPVLTANNSSITESPFKREQSSSPTTSKKIGFGMKIGSSMANKNKLGAVFNVNEDEASVTEEPKKKLTRLDDEKEPTSASTKKETTVEDKRKMIKNLIEKIPTVKEELFQYSLKWDIVDEV